MKNFSTPQICGVAELFTQILDGIFLSVSLVFLFIYFSMVIFVGVVFVF